MRAVIAGLFVRGGGARAGRRLLSLCMTLIVIGFGAAYLTAGTASATATCTIYWTGLTSNDWGTVTNWSTTNGGVPAGRTPAASDYVCMSTSATNTAVDLSSSTTATIAGINWPSSSVSPSLTVDGSLTIGTASAVPASTINVLSVTGTLALYKAEAVTTGNFTLSGNLQGPGALTVNGPATLDNAASLGSQGTSGTAAHLVLEGASAVEAGDVNLFEGSELENKGSSAVLTLQDNANLLDYDGDGNELLNDAGATITTAANTSNTFINAPAVNNGTVSVKSGTLYYGAGTAPASDSGTFTAVSGATLNIAGTQTEASGINYAGAGTIDATGQVTFTAAATLTNTGTFEIDGTAGVKSGVTVTASNLTLDGSMQGPGSMVVNGPATLAPGASIGGYDSPGTGVHLTLEGTSRVTGGVDLYEGSELENKGTSATLTLQDSAELYDYDGNGNEVLNDAGATITTAANASNTEINAPAVNNGTVSVKSGTLSYGSGTCPGVRGPEPSARQRARPWTSPAPRPRRRGSTTPARAPSTSPDR